MTSEEQGRMISACAASMVLFVAKIAISIFIVYECYQSMQHRKADHDYAKVWQLDGCVLNLDAKLAQHRKALDCLRYPLRLDESRRISEEHTRPTTMGRVVSHTTTSFVMKDSYTFVDRERDVEKLAVEIAGPEPQWPWPEEFRWRESEATMEVATRP